MAISCKLKAFIIFTIVCCVIALTFTAWFLASVYKRYGSNSASFLMSVTLGVLYEYNYHSFLVLTIPSENIKQYILCMDDCLGRGIVGSGCITFCSYAYWNRAIDELKWLKGAVEDIVTVDNPFVNDVTEDNYRII